MSFSIEHLWAQMGLFARLIVVVLGIMSVYSLGIVVERLFVHGRARKASRAYAGELQALLAAKKLDEAKALAERYKHGHLPRVLGPAVEEYRLARGQGTADQTAEAVSRSIERTSLRVTNELRRGLSVLATVGSTAPFVGLLGTVMGIVNAFQSMAASGSGGLASVSAGIAEALVTTAFGLLVAIPAVMMFNFFTNGVEDMSVDITDAGNDFIDMILKENNPASQAAAKPVLSSAEGVG